MGRANARACRCGARYSCRHARACCGCCASVGAGAAPTSEGLRREVGRAHGGGPEATARMCCLALDTLRATLHDQLHGGRTRAAIEAPSWYADITDDTACGVFVTYNKRTTTSGRLNLRGCIGTLEPGPLRRTLCTYAVAAALRDRRFHPITAAELPQLQVGVSLLVDFEPIENELDAWEIGEHGLVLDLTLAGRAYSATFLPEVALEQLWTRAETVQHLVRKAGVQEHISDALLRRIRLTRYRSSKFALAYREYATLSAAGTLFA